MTSEMTAESAVSLKGEQITPKALASFSPAVGAQRQPWDLNQKATPNLSSIPSLTVSMLGFILTLPWSVLASWVLSEVRNSVESDSEFAVLMMLAAGINAVLLYFAAIKMRRFIQ